MVEINTVKKDIAPFEFEKFVSNLRLPWTYKLKDSAVDKEPKEHTVNYPEIM